MGIGKHCAGLRLAEIVGLKLADLDLAGDCIEVRDTKFFKSRRLPLSATAMAALRDYLKARLKAGAPNYSDAPLFWHAKGGYRYVTAGAHVSERNRCPYSTSLFFENEYRSELLALAISAFGRRGHDLAAVRSLASASTSVQSRAVKPADP